MGTMVPVPPASGEAGPVALALPPKPIPLPLSGTLNPSAFITNLWLSVRVCPCGFSRSELLLIARSLPRSEIGEGASQPVVFRLQQPACTALLSPTGVLFVMGGITKEQALWQAFRVVYKLKYRVWWKPADKAKKMHFCDTCVLAIQREGAVDSQGQQSAEYLCRPEVEFNPESASILQLVCRVDLGGSFRPNVRAVLDHPQLRALSIDTRDGVAVRIPHLQGAQASQSPKSSFAETDDDVARELFAFDTEEGREPRERRAPRAKGPTCLIFRTGKVLVLGCRSPEEINAAIDFVWPALIRVHLRVDLTRLADSRWWADGDLTLALASTTGS